MIFYCPNCWREIADDKEACSHCGENPSSWEAKKYSAKLIEALAHPEPDTRSRAVYLLGEKRAVEAVEPLFSLFRRSVNPFLQGEVIEALGKIGGLSAIPVLMDALRHPSFVVRGEAVKALAKFPRNGRIQAALKRSAKDPSAYVREIVKDALKIPEQTRKAV